MGPDVFLRMPEGLFTRYVEEMPRVRAMWVIEAAQAALYAQLAKRKAAGQKWWSEWSRRARGFVHSDTTNNVLDIKRWLRSVLGTGFSE